MGTGGGELQIILQLVGERVVSARDRRKIDGCWGRGESYVHDHCADRSAAGVNGQTFLRR
jgi:hypothetical protein